MFYVLFVRFQCIKISTCHGCIMDFSGGNQRILVVLAYVNKMSFCARWHFLLQLLYSLLLERDLQTDILEMGELGF